MAQNVDFSSLYSILTGYAQKRHSPILEVNEFIDFLERYAKQHASEQPEWANWSIGTRSKFWEELKHLTKDGNCIVQERGKFRYLYLPKYCAILIENVYHGNFKASDNERIPPFPSEISLKITLPQESFTFIDVDDLDMQLEVPPDPDVLFNMSFPHSLGSILLLGSMISTNALLEAAFVRVRHHLMKDLNQEFFQKKLSHHFNEREEYPRDMLHKLIYEPRDVAGNLIEGEESSYLLWSSFCGEVKNDLENKKILSPDETTVLQASYIIEQFNTFYNQIAKKRKAKEHAFLELFGLLEKAPYLFRAAQIIKFVGSDGRPLLPKHYNQEELFDYLDGLCTPKETEAVPVLIAISDRTNSEQWYIMKQRFPLLCVRYLLDAQPILRNAVIDHWEDILLEYKTESSMNDPNKFETLLWRYLYSLIPPLAAMLQYQQFFQLYQEMDDSWDGYTEFGKLINKETGKVYPISTLLFLNQNHLLMAAQERLPFRYAFPFIGKIMLFFQKQKKKKESRKKVPSTQAADSKENYLSIKAVCRKLEAKLVPEDYTAEWYLVRLYEKWAKPFKKNEKMEEINRLIRNRLRRNAPLYKPSQINEEFLDEIANGLIEDIPTLKHLEQDSLKQYIKLYALKLLRTMQRSAFRA